MMTWVQTQKLRRDEASLMTEWQTRWAQSACFNADGVVDYERWSALPDRKHIVVLLKETNGLHGSLVEFLLMLNGSDPMKRLHCGITKAVWSAQVKKRLL